METGEAQPHDAVLLAGLGSWAVFAAFAVAFAARVGLPANISYGAAIALSLLASGCLTAALMRGAHEWGRSAAACGFVLGAAVWPAASWVAPRTYPGEALDVATYMAFLAIAVWAATILAAIPVLCLRAYDWTRVRRGRPTLDSQLGRFLSEARWRPYVLLLSGMGITGLCLPPILTAMLKPVDPSFEVPAGVQSLVIGLSGAFMAEAVFMPLRHRMAAPAPAEEDIDPPTPSHGSS